RISRAKGAFEKGKNFEQKLTEIKKNLEEEQFSVDRMIKSRGRGANKRVLVSWRGYLSKFVLILGFHLRV
ncbi:hypothetical protein ALC53_07616, partial [Atta colombica]